MTCDPNVIERWHRAPDSGKLMKMWFVHCESCHEVSQWFPEEGYAHAWADKHKLQVETVGVVHLNRAFGTERIATTYKRYRQMQDDERYSDEDRRLWKQLADELEARLPDDEDDPDQLELF